MISSHFLNYFSLQIPTNKMKLAPRIHFWRQIRSRIHDGILTTPGFISEARKRWDQYITIPESPETLGSYKSRARFWFKSCVVQRLSVRYRSRLCIGQFFSGSKNNSATTVILDLQNVFQARASPGSDSIINRTQWNIALVGRGDRQYEQCQGFEIIVSFCKFLMTSGMTNNLEMDGLRKSLQICKTLLDRLLRFSQNFGSFPRTRLR